jgi:site-specific DNA-methyltransferase (adenine-specific)
MNGEHIWLSGVECCVYGKRRGAAFNERCKNTVFRYPTVRGKLHPTAKPLAFFERLVAASSNPGDTVLDPFMGSGTTGVACVNLKRDFIGIELDADYFKIAQDRIAGAAL